MSGLNPAKFRHLAASYRRRWGIGLAAAQADGRVVHGRAPEKPSQRPVGEQARRMAIAEALRWGEPTVQLAPGDVLIWAVPLMHNSELLGGLVAAIPERQVFGASPAGLSRIDIRAACADLRRLAESHNLTNAALLEARRGHYELEQERAEAIHDFKSQPHYDIRAMYLLEEPMLVAAIRKGDRGQARATLNRLLVGVIHHAGDRLDLVKSFFMELVATMCRTAVEAGGAPEELLGANFDSLSELSRIEDEEQLAPWLHEMLERIQQSIRRAGTRSQSVQLAGALRYMSEHCCEDISRDQAAGAAHLSPSHFSRLFRKHFGQSFTTVLNQMRIERAADLLLRSDRDLKLIAIETGFADQSYFTKVFRRVHGMTPAQYRRRRDGEA